MRLKLLGLVGLSIASIGLYGCSTTNTTASAGSQGGAEVKETSGTVSKGETEVMKDITDFKLLSLVKENTDGNKMISKYSLDAVLNILAMGTSDESLRNDILTFTGLDKNKEISDQIRNKLSLEDSETLKTANGIWIDEQFELKDEFKSEVDGLGVKVSEFSDKTLAMDEMNNFADENTNHMIPEVIQDADSITEMVLMNTLYFDGKWVSPFDGDDTHTDIFTNSSGEEVEAEFMREEGNRYYETKDWIGWSKNYQGDTYEFIGVMPVDESKLVYDYSELNLDKLLKSEKKGKGKVVVKLPKFKFDWDDKLDETLNSLGLSKMYSDEYSFDKLANMDAKVSTIFQKTRIEVDEEGTKAAAVTVGMLEFMSAAPIEEEIKYIEFNRPFLFVIRNKVTGENLFTGLVNEPVV